jgi:hypothetical protein
LILGFDNSCLTARAGLETSISTAKFCEDSFLIVCIKHVFCIILTPELEKLGGGSCVAIGNIMKIWGHFGQ